MKKVSCVLCMAAALCAAMFSTAYAQVNNGIWVGNAASYQAKTSPDSMAVAFLNPAVHSNPAATKITITDSSGKQTSLTDRQVLYNSKEQVNFYLPADVAIGPAAIQIEGGGVSVGTFNVQPVAPGIFSANANGFGPPASVLLRVRADGSQTYEPLNRFDSTSGKVVATPINLGAPSDKVFLVLFGTGFRKRPDLKSVTTLAGGVPLEVVYAGAQDQIAGYDQINALIPRSLAGAGMVTLVMGVSGQEANRADLLFGPATATFAAEVSNADSFTDSVLPSSEIVAPNALSMVAASTGSFILFEDTTSGQSVIPSDFKFDLPPVGVTRTWFDGQFRGVFTNNEGFGFLFDHDPRQSPVPVPGKVLVQISRLAENKVFVWVNFGGIQLPTKANLHPSGRGPLASFTAEWFEVEGKLQLNVKYDYVVMSYLDVNVVATDRPPRATMPDSYKDRIGLAGDTWQANPGSATSPLVSWGVIESPGLSVSTTVIQFNRNNGNSGQVNLGKLQVAR